MAGVGYTRCAALGPIVDCVDGLGGRIDRVFAQADIPMGILECPDLPLRLSDHYAILGAAARETGDAAFGARLGARVKTLHLSDYGRWVMAAPSLSGAVARAGAGLNTLMQTDTDLVLTPVEDGLCWSMVFHTRGHRGRYQNELLAVSYLIDSLRAYLGPTWHPLKVRVIGAGPVRELERIFAAPVEPGHDACGVVFDGRDLAAVHPGVVPIAADMPDGPGSLAAIHAAVQLELLGGRPQVDRVAARLGMTRRTLQRRLAEAGTRFGDVAGALQYARARDLLAREPVGEVAAALGYSDPAHFTRAFRRWSGQSPRHWQRNQ